LFDESGRVVLDQGGFANWLSWLKNTQNEPNFILDNDEATLAALFKAGNLAYFIGPRPLLPSLQQALGTDAVGVITLPQGPIAPASPFLRTQSLMLNTYSSATQSEIAFRLAKFLTNTEQQTKLVRQTGRVPANIRARVDPQVYPLVASFLAQAKTAVPVLNIPQMETVLNYGDETYLQILTGEIEPNDAAKTLTNRINGEYGLEPLPPEPAVTCALTGTLEVWHRWDQVPEGPVLQQIADEFSAGCPGVTVNLTAFDTETLFKRYQAAAATNSGPDIIIGPNLWIVPWADKKLIGRLDAVIQPELLQQYTSLAKIAMQNNQGLFGLPLSLELMGLYYRTDRVTDPPRVADDLLNQATPEQQVALPVSFYYSSWGSLAFGSVTYDVDYQPEFNPTGFKEWLRWLKKAQAQSGVVLNPDPAQLQPLFVSGKATYYAGDASELYTLQQALGKDKIRVVPLPSGPADEARPQLIVEGVMLNPATLANESQAALALRFATYLTNLDSQTQLMAQAARVPSLVNADTIAYPAIAGFLEQAKTAVPLINTPEEIQLQQLVDEMYTRVIFGNADPAETVEAAVEQLNKGGN
jgi:arabinogalactan oligomer/maltooligosaccharide transport system substrate-binding protein